MQHKGTVALETDRLILRRFTLEDAASVYENWASDDEVTKYLTWPSHPNVEESYAYLQFVIGGYSLDNRYQWGIERKDTHELIGNISVVDFNPYVDGIELGWVIGRKWWGCGYTAEAAREVVHFLFTEVEAKRIAARHDIENPNSGRVMQKIGMKYEGTLRQSGCNNRGIVDCVHYSILRDEYEG